MSFWAEIPDRNIQKFQKEIPENILCMFLLLIKTGLFELSAADSLKNSEPEDGLEATLLHRWFCHLPWQLSGLWSRVRNATAEHRSDATELQLVHSFFRQTGSDNRALNIYRYLYILLSLFVNILGEKSQTLLVSNMRCPAATLIVESTVLSRWHQCLTA